MTKKKTGSKPIAEYDMLVTAVEKKDRVMKDDTVETTYLIKAKQEATTNVRLVIKFTDQASLDATGLRPRMRFQLKVSIDQSTIQEWKDEEEDGGE